ncbi:MAG: PAS domain-containing protein [Cyclobacteriaceae bacterium]|nr:PAS domain-containing protein [Cyclobacteriaceae bacterium]
MNIRKETAYHTSEIIVNSNGRVLNTDKAFCEILNCKSPNVIHNSTILDYVVEEDRKTVVNAFIDTFYGQQEGKLLEIKMIDYLGKEIEVTFNFFPIKSSNGEKSTLLIRKKMF